MSQTTRIIMIPFPKLSTRKKGIFTCLLTLMILASISAYANAPASHDRSDFALAEAQTPDSLVRFISKTGTIKADFRVELAITPSEHRNGLQHRTHLEEDAGMLFLFEDDQYISMWMADTPISLDMLFINRQGQVVAIARKTTPFSQDTISPPSPICAVLEINAQQAEKKDIQPGDRVILSRGESDKSEQRLCFEPPSDISYSLPPSGLFGLLGLSIF